VLHETKAIPSITKPRC